MSRLDPGSHREARSIAPECSAVDRAARRAAILLANLQPRAACELLSQLSPEQQAALEAGLASLSQAPPDCEEQQQAIGAFFERVPPQLGCDGIELFGSLADSLSGSRRHDCGSLLVDDATHDLVQVLHQLPASQVAEILAHLEPQCQAEIAARLAECEPEILEIGPPTAGLTALPGEPARHGEPVRHTLAESASEFDDLDADEATAEEETHVASHDDVPLEDLDQETLLQVLRQVDAQVAVLALAGSSHALVERLLQRLPLREARLVRHELDHLSGVSLQDVELARREILFQARRFAETGSLADGAYRPSLQVAV